MATITINGKTTEIPAHVLHRIAKEARQYLDAMPNCGDEINEAAAKAREIEDFAAERLNDAPTHYHVEGYQLGTWRNTLFGHYVEPEHWVEKGWIPTLCGTKLNEPIRVDLPPGDVAPTPSKPLCPRCKELHDGLERWPG